MVNLENLESTDNPYPTGGVLRILREADYEARRVKHNFIGTEHFVLGMIKVDWMSPLYAATGLELNLLRDRLIMITGMGNRVVLNRLTFTPNAKSVLGIARASAVQDRYPFYDSTHLLRGMLLTDILRGTTGGQLLDSNGSIDRLRSLVSEGGILEDIRKREMQFHR